MTTKQRAYLKGLAMNLDPIFQIGKNSMTPEVTKAIQEALDARELIKISVLKNCADDPRALAEVIAETGKEELKEIGYEDPTDEQGTAFINNSINFVYADKGERSPAFDYKPVLKTTVITINTSHKFYTSFLSKIYSNAEVKTTFELFLASLIQSVRKTDPYQAVQNDRLMTTWYNRLNNYIAEQLNPRDMK